LISNVSIYREIERLRFVHTVNYIQDLSNP